MKIQEDSWSELKGRYLLVTVDGVFGAARVARESENTAFRAFDAALHPCSRRKLILILQCCFLKPTHTI